MSAGGSLLILGRRGPSPGSWPPPPREALPLPICTVAAVQPPAPEASSWTVDDFDKAVPFVPFTFPNIDFHLGNVMGVRGRNLPQVGGNCADPNFIVTWFEYQYAKLGASAECIDAHVRAGYTHWDHHRAAWMGRMVKEGVPACTRDEALQSVARVAQKIPFGIVNLAIDNGPPDPNELKPWIDDLIAAGMKIACLAWQIDQRINVPLDLCDYIAWAAPYCQARGCKVSTHWVNSGCAVYDPETCARYGVCDRTSFQQFCDRMGVNYIYQQFDVNAELLDVRPKKGGIIGEAGDMLRSLQGTNLKLIYGEGDMQAEFNNPSQRLELYGDAKARCMMSVNAFGQHLWGSLNGLRDYDGSVLLKGRAS